MGFTYVSHLCTIVAHPVFSFGLCLHNADLPEGKGWHSSFGTMMDIKMRAIGGTRRFVWVEAPEDELIGCAFSNTEYKFFLAFENNNFVEDYVTEKLINALYAGTVPVYQGAPNSTSSLRHACLRLLACVSPELLTAVEDWVPGSNAIIHARDLSPKELADLLLKLNEVRPIQESICSLSA